MWIVNVNSYCNSYLILILIVTNRANICHKGVDWQGFFSQHNTKHVHHDKHGNPELQQHHFLFDGSLIQVLFLKWNKWNNSFPPILPQLGQANLSQFQFTAEVVNLSRNLVSDGSTALADFKAIPILNGGSSSVNVCTYMVVYVCMYVYISVCMWCMCTLVCVWCVCACVHVMYLHMYV